MKLEYIDTFLVVAEVGSMNMAAQKLFITAAGTKKQIDRLEAEIGTDLFIRSNQGMTLTGAGKYFYDHIKKLHSSWDELRHHMKQYDKLEEPFKNSHSPACYFTTLDYLMEIT